MKLGDEVLARLMARLSESKWSVQCPELPKGASAILNSRTGRLYQPDDEERLWIYDIQNHIPVFLLSDSNFGRLPISDRMRPRYIQSLKSVLSLLSDLEGGTSIEPDHLSEVKGLLNRCVRKDQWDWFSVYAALGRPASATLRQAASELGYVARALKDKDDAGVEQHLGFLVNSNIRSSLERCLLTIQSTSPKLESAKSFDTQLRFSVGSELTSADESGDPYIISQVAKAKLERANKSHEATLQVLVKFLQSNGFLVEYSRLVDAYCRLKTGPAIFEVKSINSDNERAQCRHALSQLYEYRYLHSVPQSSLWLVLSEPPRYGWIVDYLKDDRGVGVLWVEQGTLQGPGMEQLLSSWTTTKG